MKIRVLLFAAGAFFAWSSLHAADTPKRGDDDDDMTELGEHMEKMGSAFKHIIRDLKDPAKKDDAIQRVAVMHEQAEAALTLQPEKTADLPADKRTAFVDAFHKKIQDLIVDIDKFGADLKAGGDEQIKKDIETLKNDMRQGHHEFQKKKPHKM